MEKNPIYYAENIAGNEEEELTCLQCGSNQFSYVGNYAGFVHYVCDECKEENILHEKKIMS